MLVRYPNLAMVHQRRGDYAEAIACHEAALTITRESTDPVRESRIVVNLAETLHVCGHHETAIARATESLEICEQHQNRRGIGLALRVLGDAHARLGRAAQARRHWQDALAILDGLDVEASAKLRAALDGPASVQ